MAVDYRKQYRPHQLEPFWPNEIMKMSTAVLCTLALIMIFVILPVALDAIGLGGAVHTEEPADPQGTTPVGIKPEWYFLSSYQYLRLMPTALFGVSGKVLGVVTQGVLFLVILGLPFWYRRGADERPRWGYRIAVTAVVLGFIGLTIWGGWPADHAEAGEKIVPFAEYLRQRPLLFLAIAAGLVVFYALVAQERSTIRRTLDGPPPEGADEEPR